MAIKVLERHTIEGDGETFIEYVRWYCSLCVSEKRTVYINDRWAYGDNTAARRDGHTGEEIDACSCCILAMPAFREHLSSSITPDAQRPPGSPSEKPP